MVGAMSWTYGIATVLERCLRSIGRRVKHLTLCSGAEGIGGWMATTAPELTLHNGAKGNFHGVTAEGRNASPILPKTPDDSIAHGATGSSHLRCFVPLVRKSIACCALMSSSCLLASHC